MYSSLNWNLFSILKLVEDNERYRETTYSLFKLFEVLNEDKIYPKQYKANVIPKNISNYKDKFINLLKKFYQKHKNPYVYYFKHLANKSEGKNPNYFSTKYFPYIPKKDTIDFFIIIYLIKNEIMKIFNLIILGSDEIYKIIDKDKKKLFTKEIKEFKRLQLHGVMNYSHFEHYLKFFDDKYDDEWFEEEEKLCKTK